MTKPSAGFIPRDLGRGPGVISVEYGTQPSIA